jgi:hypothetical protein
MIARRIREHALTQRRVESGDLGCSIGWATGILTRID